MPRKQKKRLKKEKKEILRKKEADKNSKDVRLRKEDEERRNKEEEKKREEYIDALTSIATRSYVPVIPMTSQVDGGHFSIT